MRSRIPFPKSQLMVLVCLATLFEVSVAQAPGTGEGSGEGVSLAKLYLPVYPPLARTACVTGDVTIRVRVRLDGSISSAQEISGHPLLERAALESAQRSTFICRNCKEETSLELTYTFLLREDIDCTVRRLRSSKCFYLWKCGGWRDNRVARPVNISQSKNRTTILADSVS